MNNKIKAGLGILVLLLGAYFMSSSDDDGTLEVSVMELGRKDLKRPDSTYASLNIF